jgi:hypothetical protein
MNKTLSLPPKKWRLCGAVVRLSPMRYSELAVEVVARRLSAAK